jgi:hypothetical protein
VAALFFSGHANVGTGRAAFLPISKRAQSILLSDGNITARKLSTRHLGGLSREPRDLDTAGRDIGDD